MNTYRITLHFSRFKLLWRNTLFAVNFGGGAYNPDEVQLKLTIRHSAQLNGNSASISSHVRWYSIQCKRIRQVFVQFRHSASFSSYSHHSVWSQALKALFKQFRHRNKTKIFEFFFRNDPFQLQVSRFSEMLCHRLSPYPHLCAVVNDFQDTFSM